MAEVNDLDVLNRKIAADLLQTLITKGQIQFAATTRPDVVVPEVVKAYRDLLSGIEDKKST